MTLDSEKNVSLLLDPFAQTEQESIRINKFDLMKRDKNGEKVRLKNNYCTMVTVGGKYLEKNRFKKVMKMVDNIRKKSATFNLKKFYLFKHRK